MSTEDIATLKLGINTAASFTGSYIVWRPSDGVAHRVVSLLESAICAPRVELADGKHVTLTRPEITLASFALVTHLAAPAAQPAT